jgi:hypothetical protein
MKLPTLTPNPRPVREPTKLSEEEGFIIYDLRGSTGVEIPAMPGLLGFLRIDGDKETMTKMLMLDDLAKGFIENIRYAGGADRVAYIIFPPVADFSKRTAGLTARLELFSQLTAKYSGQRNSRPGFAG